MIDKAEQSTKISNNIKELRAERGWNQARLAEEAGITAAALSKIESGAGRIPTMVVLRKLAGALGVTVDQITGESQEVLSADDEKVSSFYRRWGALDDLPEDDQKRLLELAERLKEITKPNDK